MFNEIRFSEYVDSGQIVDKINLTDFLKVYLNHRPPFGNTMYFVQRSFNILGYTNSEGKKVIRREDFLKLLLTKGEPVLRDVWSHPWAVPTAESWVRGDRPPGIFVYRRGFGPRDARAGPCTPSGGRTLCSPFLKLQDPVSSLIKQGYKCQPSISQGRSEIQLSWDGMRS